ncbi:hypothetical protein E2K80_16490 [Rhodophyticola sp. CCM32]|uniref:hypothetical protein n=1 Tax=Rhodophyticola sp. CCM32 TaxID=2916397 RepID=UPI00107F0357|nr:hypothetical protein [Rhodophyticola sp. CCM32]QBY02137.1 hypothetical protein E2K80_16490 [Rhodophyticola sp. CCM32]
MAATKTSVVIIGSGPNAVSVRDWDRSSFTHMVAINNAWRLRPDWDFAIFPEDFPADQRPPAPGPGQSWVEAAQYVPTQNRFGGFVYAGGTMAFTTGYWVLAALRPSVMGFIGCDMVYPSVGNTHFYGKGAADPLRKDVTLQSLEAKSARLALLAAANGCACVNLSQDASRLVFPRADVAGLAAERPVTADPDGVAKAQARERELGYMVTSGRYWEVADQFDAGALRGLDAMWLAAYQTSLKPACPSQSDRRLG